jgi:hypothetical protein
MRSNVFWMNLFIAAHLVFSSIASAQNTTLMNEESIAVHIVQQQLDAYNAQNIEAFIALFDEKAEIFNLGQATPIASGKEAIFQIYDNLFKQSPHLHSEVVNRSVIGNKVIDYELITGRAGSNELTYIVAIYEIENALIKRCYFIRK